MRLGFGGANKSAANVRLNGLLPYAKRGYSLCARKLMGLIFDLTTV